MATTNTKSTLDSQFKYKVAPKVKDLKPQQTVFYNDAGDLKEAQKTGRKYLCPVALTWENGFTHGDDTAFAFNAPVAGVYEEIEIDSTPTVLRSQVALSAANRMAAEPQAFISRMSLQTGNMKESLVRMADVEILYGKAGIGQVEGSPSVNGTSATIVLDAYTWAPGIWAGREGIALDCYSSSTKKNTNADIVLASVDFENKTLSVTGNATDLAAVKDGYDLFFKGGYSNGMVGVDKQLTNSGSLFGIDASVYGLWKANSVVVNGPLTIGKVLAGVGKARAKGGLMGPCKCYVSDATWENLNTNEAALRAYDQSYTSTKAEKGVEGIVYHSMSGKITIVASSIVKEGEAFILPEGAMKKVGATDVTFDQGNGTDDFFLPLASNAGYELRAQYDFCVLIDEPAKCVKFSNIVNS